jgi:hypothetical protein
MKEIDAAISSATVVGINVNYNEVTEKNDAVITFSAEPSAEDKTTVEGAIEAHEGTKSTRDAQKWVSQAEQTSTDTAWETVLHKETSPLRAGEWQLDVSLEIKSGASSLSSAAKARLIAEKLGGSAEERAAWASNIQLYDGKSSRIPFTAEEADQWEFAIQICQVGGTTAYARRMRVSLTYSGVTPV